jgi:hypothetical protein
MISRAISQSALLRCSVRDVAGFLAHTGLGRRAPRRWSDIVCSRRSLRCAQGRRLIGCSQKDRSAIRLRSDLLRLRLPVIDAPVASNDRAARQIFREKQESFSGVPEIPRRPAVIRLRQANHLDAASKAVARCDIPGALRAARKAIGNAPDVVEHRLLIEDASGEASASMQLTRTLFSFRIWSQPAT